MRLFLSLLLTGFLATVTTASAQEALGLVTGSKAGTYYLIGQDIKDAAAKEDVAIELRESGGSVDNLQKMATTGENAALGIVQSDVLSFLMRSDKPNSKEIVRKLRLVMPLFKEEVHLMARSEIATIDDLKDKRVVVGSSGSGSMMTAVNLLSQLDIKPKRLYEVSPAEAVVAVLANRADAMVFVGGKPVPMFRNLQNLAAANDPKMANLLNTVHFLELPASKAKGIYETATLTPQDYDFVRAPVSTFAVRAALVSYDFTLKNTPYYKQRCSQLVQLGRAIAKALPELQTSGHRKWQEVNLTRELPFWKHDSCAWAGIQSMAAGDKSVSEMMVDAENNGAAVGAATTPADHSPFEDELLGIITGSKTE